MSADAPTGVTATATADGPSLSALSQFSADLADIVKSTGHDEMWGVTLKDADDVPTSIVLTKFLRANAGDVAVAKKQLISALEWRKKVNPLELVKQSYNEDKFGGLGYVTTHKDETGKVTIISWNIYGGVKDNEKTFGDVEEFIQWRVALMELSVQKLNLPTATERIPEDGEDPYRMIQVHDYLSVNFYRPDPNVKKASKRAIQVFSITYPELLAHKYFVNVPILMGWMYALMKLFVAPATLKKFHPLSSGTALATELPGLVSTLPEVYGGKGQDVKTAGETVGLTKVPTPAGEEKKEVDEVAVAPATAVEDKPVPTATEVPNATEATKPTDLPNPLGSAPVQPAADSKPSEEAEPELPAIVETDAAVAPIETKAEPAATEESKPDSKA